MTFIFTSCRCCGFPRDGKSNFFRPLRITPEKYKTRRNFEFTNLQSEFIHNYCIHFCIHLSRKLNFHPTSATPFFALKMVHFFCLIMHSFVRKRNAECRFKKKMWKIEVWCTRVDGSVWSTVGSSRMESRPRTRGCIAQMSTCIQGAHV